MTAEKQELPPFSYVEVTEQKRLNAAREQGIPWRKWGPYLSERQWAQSARTTATMGMPGATSLTTSPDLGLTAGAKMA